jgi:carbonic anhydrase
MCHCATTASRRQLLALGVGAGAAGLLPTAARAATVTALAITCIDYRLVDDTAHFFGERHLTGDYDQVALAGASLAAVSPKFRSSNAAFWDHVAIARQLHAIRKVIVIDHRDCGAFKVAYGKDFHGQGAAEAQQHKAVMQQVQARLKTRHPELAGEFWLMGLDGRAERLV